MNFSAPLLLEMKLGLHTTHLKPKGSLNSGVTPLHPPPKRFKTTNSAKKIMVSVFWDCRRKTLALSKENGKVTWAVGEKGPEKYIWPMLWEQPMED
uniref:Uncharacterized protein n=1 Tax=Rhodnius prolixus TaxID=13249 RepID=T1HA11_RHOPR